MTDLVEWLLQQISADEAVVAEGMHNTPFAELDNQSELQGDWGYHSEPGLVVDPRRVLAECAAKRQVIGRCVWILGVDGWEYSDAPKLAEEVIRLLAAPYADRAGFDASWLEETT